jgi:hypothetical protein
MKKEERFACPLRDYEAIPIKQYDSRVPCEGADFWVERENGDLCCSYCGGWHPEQFIRFCSKVAEDPSLYIRVEHARQDGKFWITQPDVKNALQGAVKAWRVHLEKWLENLDLGVEVEVITEEFIQKAIKASERKNRIILAERAELKKVG